MVTLDAVPKTAQSSGKGKADSRADGDAIVNMLETDTVDPEVQQVNMHEDYVEESEPDDTGISDCAPALFLVSRVHLKKHCSWLARLRCLSRQVLDLLKRFSFWTWRRGQDQHLRAAAYMV